MKNTGALEITAAGEREIVITRAFDAPRRLVWEAYTKPALLKKWLLGPDGWELIVCDMDLRVGGKYRWVWRKEKIGKEMGMGGVYREVEAPERIVSTEKFDDPWYPGEGVGTLVLTEEGNKTKLVQTTLYESREARDGVLKSPMDEGLIASYDRLEKVLESLR
jgi:uncharacterized protein YndB with AHSA1/START domain